MRRKYSNILLNLESQPDLLAVWVGTSRISYSVSHLQPTNTPWVRGGQIRTTWDPGRATQSKLIRGLHLVLESAQVIPDLILLNKPVFVQQPVFLEPQQHSVHFRGALLYLFLLSLAHRPYSTSSTLKAPKNVVSNFKMCLLCNMKYSWINKQQLKLGKVYEEFNSKTQLICWTVWVKQIR